MEIILKCDDIKKNFAKKFGSSKLTYNLSVQIC